jgi:beta-1,4-mannosyl-glycoprotein beta-1,4-N-acetylglucosaminyltransferase
LKYLYNHVDKFYICEKKYTHQGYLKETLYIDLCKEWFSDYMDKIVFVIDDTPILENAMANEINHRNYSASVILKDYPNEQFVVSVCDCDEIPDVRAFSSKIYNACSDVPLYMKQDFYYYNLNWLVGGPWIAPFFINNISIKNLTFQECRDKKFHGETINCGWHLSYFSSPSEIKRKIESFSHTEYNTEEYTDLDFIHLCTHSGQDLYRRPHVKLTKVSREFPPEIKEFGDYIYNIQSERIDQV